MLRRYGSTRGTHVANGRPFGAVGREQEMNGAKKQALGAVAVGVFVALVVSAPASAVQLVEFTIETDKEVYQVGELVGLTYHVYNAGDEDLHDPLGSDHVVGTAIWVFENAAGLSRDDLLGEEQPISTMPLYVHCWYHPLSPGKTSTSTCYLPLHDNLDNLIGPGEYTLLAVDGPHPEVWWGATVGYANAYPNITIVPEPGTICLLAGIAAAGLLGKGRRRRQG